MGAPNLTLKRAQKFSVTPLPKALGGYGPGDPSPLVCATDHICRVKYVDYKSENPQGISQRTYYFLSCGLRTHGRLVTGSSPGTTEDPSCRGGTATAGSDVVQSGRPIFDDFFQHLWPYISNNTANVVFQMVRRLWLIRIDL
ncbi:hypothetical protein TNCV_2895761 [Trichonephila clavipes]|nr:hypothetical protein TNCV_2895761 [Trichonephila clavipes]